MNLYDATVPVFTKQLRAIDKWLDKAVAYADTKKFDPEILVQARLAPDQFSFVRQVQSACDQAKWCCAKLSGKEGPSHPDTEKTIAEVRARLATVVGYLETFTREEFIGSEDRICRHMWMPEGKGVRGGDYLDHVILPNFYFHVAHAYAILRHNGVPLGKMDYLTSIPFVAA